MADAHTPGPWTFGYDDHSGPEFIVGADQKAVATLRWGCSCCKDTPENFLDMKPYERANARLIAAAPDLLDACRKALAALKGREHDQFLRDAISKATGAK